MCTAEIFLLHLSLENSQLPSEFLAFLYLRLGLRQLLESEKPIKVVQRFSLAAWILMLDASPFPKNFGETEVRDTDALWHQYGIQPRPWSSTESIQYATSQGFLVYVQKLFCFVAVKFKVKHQISGCFTYNMLTACVSPPFRGLFDCQLCDVLLRRLSGHKTAGCWWEDLEANFSTTVAVCAQCYDSWYVPLMLLWHHICSIVRACPDLWNLAPSLLRLFLEGPGWKSVPSNYTQYPMRRNLIR